MARKMSTVYYGKFMVALKDIYFEKYGTDELFVRSSVKDDRKTLEKPELINIFQSLDVTVLDVFEKAGLALTVSDEDRLIIRTLEKMKASRLEQVLSAIREICDAWWVEFLDSDDATSCTTVARFKRFGVHKFAASAEMDPIPSSLEDFFPCRKVTKIDTDKLPELCRYAEIPVSYLMDLPIDKVHFYSKNALADRVYTEYKLILSESLRDVVRKVIFTL